MMIHASELGRSFGGRWSVRELDLAVAAGEVFGILGPNGAGKTTTVRLLCGLIRPSSGEAWIDGISVRQDPNAVRARVGLLTESPGHYEVLSARANLTFHADLHGLAPPTREERVEHYLRLMDLWDRRNEAVGGYSKGMRQRLAIARALLHEPPVLFLDEPTSGLDPEAAAAMREFIGLLRQEGRTIVLTTHNLDEAARLCDRVGFLRGRLLRVDAPAALGSALFGRRVAVGLASPGAGLESVARGLPFVRDVVARDDGLLVELADPARDVPDLVAALVGVGARIARVGEVEHSLEEVYHAVMRGTEP